MERQPMIAAQRRFIEKMNKKNRFRAPNPFQNLPKTAHPPQIEDKIENRILFLAIAAPTALDALTKRKLKKS